MTYCFASVYIYFFLSYVICNTFFQSVFSFYVRAVKNLKFNLFIEENGPTLHICEWQKYVNF